MCERNKSLWLQHTHTHTLHASLILLLARREARAVESWNKGAWVRMDMIKMCLLIMINATVRIKREHILTHSSSVNTHLSNFCLSHTSLSTKSSVYCILHTSHSRFNPHFQDWAHKMRSLKNKIHIGQTLIWEVAETCVHQCRWCGLLQLICFAVKFLNIPTTESVQFHKILRLTENIDYYYLLYYILPHGQIHLSCFKDNLHFLLDLCLKQ